MGKFPCQNLHGGTGSAIYMNEDGLCDHLECAEARIEELEDEIAEWKLNYINVCEKKDLLMEDKDG